jgi:hypothetical protein
MEPGGGGEGRVDGGMRGSAYAKINGWGGECGRRGIGQRIPRVESSARKEGRRGRADGRQTHGSAGRRVANDVCFFLLS